MPCAQAEERWTNAYAPTKCVCVCVCIACAQVVQLNFCLVVCVAAAATYDAMACVCVCAVCLHTHRNCTEPTYTQTHTQEPAAAAANRNHNFKSESLKRKRLRDITGALCARVPVRCHRRQESHDDQTLHNTELMGSVVWRSAARHTDTDTLNRQKYHPRVVCVCVVFSQALYVWNNAAYFSYKRRRFSQPYATTTGVLMMEWGATRVSVMYVYVCINRRRFFTYSFFVCVCVLCLREGLLSV